MHVEGGNARVMVQVDHDVCSGTAHCQQSMPQVFVVTNRKAHVRSDVDWATVDRDALDRTAEACPWFAITVSSPPPSPSPSPSPSPQPSPSPGGS